MAELRCDMDRSCDAPVTYVDSKGYVYCKWHGLQRKTTQRCRELTSVERRKLEAGQTISYERKG